ncbi:MAG: phosphatase PAP2 family protein [Promethearchaeota archaeon]|jgi:undecaprenyl-diphosphatase
MSSLSEYLEKLEEWDHKAFLHVYRSGFSKRTKKFAIAFSFLGSLYFWGLIWLVWFFYGYITKDYYLIVLFTSGFEQSIIIHSIVKYKIIKRNRPYIKLKKEGVKKHDDFIRIPYLMSESDKKSFPSGHVAFFLLFGSIFAFYLHSWIILIIFISLDIVIALSRLVLGVHFPIDVIFGFIFGILYALLFLGVTYIYWLELYFWIGPLFSNIFHFWL